MTAEFTRSDARDYDRHCIEACGIAGVELMERAARGSAGIATGMLRDRDGTVVVACGPGQNGGDGYAIARLLRERGHAVRVIALGVPRAESDAGLMRARLHGVAIAPFEPAHADELRRSIGAPALVVDALFGTGLDRPLEGDALAAVRWVNALGAPVLSIDIPSGLDCDRGVPMPECVRATVTATMVAAKAGFAVARAWTGRVEVVPLGGPDPGDWLRTRGAGG